MKEYLELNILGVLKPLLYILRIYCDNMALLLRSRKIAEKMACCPEGALGQLGTQGYVCKVRVIQTFNK